MNVNNLAAPFFGDGAALDRLLAEFTERAVARRAEGLLLVGSFARGEAGPFSDLDLIALGEGPDYELEAADGWLVSWSWRTPEAQRRLFRDPANGPLEIVAWRTGRVLLDPLGKVAALVALAGMGNAAPMAAETVSLVARELAGLAEEAFKIANAVVRRDTMQIAVQTRFLAIRLFVLRARILDLALEQEADTWQTGNDDRLAAPLLAEALLSGIDPGKCESPRAALAVLRAYLQIAEAVLSTDREQDAAVLTLAIQRLTRFANEIDPDVTVPPGTTAS